MKNLYEKQKVKTNLHTILRTVSCLIKIVVAVVVRFRLWLNCCYLHNVISMSVQLHNNFFKAHFCFNLLTYSYITNMIYLDNDCCFKS